MTDLPPITRADFLQAGRKVGKSFAESLAPRRHDWDPRPPIPWADGVCRNCGMTGDERRALTGPLARLLIPDLHPCTGNAYVCRVARKLFASKAGSWPHVLDERVVPAEGGEGPWYSAHSRPVHPWQMTGEDLARHLMSLFAKPITDPFMGLLASISCNPAVCPILADALEGASCTDELLLAALRTT